MRRTFVFLLVIQVCISAKKIQDVFNFYPFDEAKTVVAEIDALGTVETDDNIKFCTNKLHIIKEIAWSDIYKLCNTGDCNTGNRNTGNCNTGDWNTGDCNTGCFMTIEPTIMLFNKPSSWKYRDWLNSDARYLLNCIPRDVVDWVSSEYMSEEEKKSHPEHETTGGYLKVLDEKDCVQMWWDGLSKKKDVIFSLPNFDAAIFKQCTGITV